MGNEPSQTNKTLESVLKDLEGNPFGIITQLGYQELSQKLDRQGEKNEERFHRWFLSGLIAIAIIGLTSAAALAGFGVLLTKQSGVTDEIQTQRYGSVLDLCLDQNERHDKVIKAIDDAVAAVPPPPAEQQRARESAKPFKLILEAAVPYTADCRKAAHDRVQGTSG